MKNLLAAVTLLAAASLAACNVDSPSAVDVSSSAVLFAKKPTDCVFATPNGKTHAVPAQSNRCARPVPPNLIGTYVPTVITVIQDGESFDILAGGGEFELVLNQDGTTGGYFFVPPVPGEDGSGLDVDLAGTFTYENGTIVLDTYADTPLDGYVFTVENNTLSGAAVIDPDDPYGLEIVLVKQ